MIVRELIAELDQCPPDMDVSAFTVFTATYGEGVWVHIARVVVNTNGVGVTLEEADVSDRQRRAMVEAR